MIYTLNVRLKSYPKTTSFTKPEGVRAGADSNNLNTCSCSKEKSQHVCILKYAHKNHHFDNSTCEAFSSNDKIRYSLIFFLPMESKRKGRWTCLTTFCVVSCKCFYFQRYTICAFIHGSKKLTGFQQFRFHFFFKKPFNCDVVVVLCLVVWLSSGCSSCLLPPESRPNPKPKAPQILPNACCPAQ
jgi:hypothetical protein